MNLQNVKKIVMPDGEVKTIRNSNGDLLWGKVNYEVKYSGDSSQSSTPTPDAPVAVQTVTGENTIVIGRGKNLFDGVNANAKTGYILNNSGTEVSDNTGGYTRNYSLVNPNTTYTLSGMPPSGTRRIYFYDGSKTFLSRSNGYTSASTITFTTPANCYFMNIQIYTNTDTGSAMASWQIEIGSIATAFEPYQGQSYEVNLGKNLFDKDNANIFNGYLGSSGIVEAANGRSVYIPVVAGQTYTFSRANSTSQANDPYYAFIANEPAGGGQYIEGRHAVGQNDLTFTGTAPAGSKYLIFYFAWNPSAETQATILSTYQFEKGSTATSYAPYFTPIELCKIGTYQDYIWKDGDTWKVHKATNKTTLTGSEGWYNAGGNAPFGLVIDDSLITISNDEPPLVYCDKFYPVSQNASWSAYSSLISSNNTGTSTKTIRIRYTSVADLSAFQTWLSSNNTILYYVLATATDTTITNAMLIAQLEAVEEWLRRYGYNATVSGNLPIIIDRTAL